MDAITALRFLVPGFGLLVLCGLPHTAQAEPQSPARTQNVSPTTSVQYERLLDQAIEAFDAQDYARSRTLFEQAYALRPNARVLRGLGISALHLERYSVAKRELTAALAETKQPLTSAQRDGIKQLLSWMKSQLGSVQLKLQPANAKVELDGEPVTESELVVPPGTHSIRISAVDFDSQQQALKIAEGQSRTLEVALTPHSLQPAQVAAASEPVTSREAHGPPLPVRFDEGDSATHDSSSLLDRWWFWTAIGVVVVGGVATTVALTAGSSGNTYEQGGLGGVIMPLGRTP